MIVIYNPTAGRHRGDFMQKIFNQIKDAGENIDLRPTTCAGDATQIAMTVSADHEDVIVAAGGDGTIAEVANGLLQNPNRKNLKLGIIPMGTANVLAHEIGLSSSPKSIAQTLLHGRAIPLHPSRMTFKDEKEHHFFLMAGAGFDAAVVEAVKPPFKKRFGKIAYIIQALRFAVTKTFSNLDVTVDGKSYTAKTVIVSNGKHYGGPYILSPNAHISSESLEVLLLPKSGGFHALHQGLALMLGTLHRTPKATKLTAKTVTISGHGSLPLQADGDTAGKLPVTIEVTTTPLTILVPN